MAVHSRWWINSLKKTALILLFIWTFFPFTNSQDPYAGQSPPDTFYYAHVTASYTNRNNQHIKKKFEGKYGYGNDPADIISGIVVHVVSYNNNGANSGKNHYGCSAYTPETKIPTGKKWIALVERGSCDFADKLRYAVRENNASALVVYNNITYADGQVKKDHIVDACGTGKLCRAVSIARKEGLEVAQIIIDSGRVHMTIKAQLDQEKNLQVQNSISKTSVLFVSISFVVLMVISLAWLLFYYIQRFRYSHAKERLARRLACAAKKAIAKIPQKTIKAGDQELEGDFDQCAVCIEQYKPHDIVRILPCRHVFHKSCVDPWLLDQRSCPMCKLDILGALGMQVGGSQESVHADLESGPAQPMMSSEEREGEEASSSQGEATHDDLKVLLVPHSCLHFHSPNAHNDEDEDDDDDEEEEDHEEDGEAKPSSPSAGPSLDRASTSRAEKLDKEGGASAEVKALIGKKGGQHKQKKAKQHRPTSVEVEEVNVDVVVEPVAPANTQTDEAAAGTSNPELQYRDGSHGSATSDPASTSHHSLEALA